MFKIKFSHLVIAVLTSSMVYFGAVGLVRAAEAPQLNSRLEIVSDGNPGFDSADYGPGPDGQFGSTSNGDPLKTDNENFGQDSSSNNLLVRASDDITYRAQISINGADANPTATLSLSSGQAWVGLPSDCIAGGSSISADRLTLICELGNRHQGTLASFKAIAKVKANTPTNTMVGVSLSAVAPGSNTTTATSDQIRVTASTKVNLIKEILNPGDSFTVPNPSGGPGVGRTVKYGIGIYAEKGSEALDGSDITFTDTLSYASGSPTNYLLAGGASACGQNTVEGGILPYGKIGVVGGADSSNSVVESGTITCSQSGAGQPINVTISGYDSSLATSPSKTSNSANVISGDRQFFVAGYIDIWVPVTDLTDPANDTCGGGGCYTLDTTKYFCSN